MSQSEPKNTYRAKVWAEKLAKATRLRIHPDKLEEVLAMIESIAEQVPNLAKSGGVITDDRLDPGQVLLENMPIEQPSSEETDL